MELIPISVEELLERYAAGERNFAGVDFDYNDTIGILKMGST